MFTWQYNIYESSYMDVCLRMYLFVYLIKKIITIVKRISPSRNLRLEMFEFKNLVVIYLP